MEARFQAVDAELAKTFTGRLMPEPGDYHAKGAVYLPENARFSRLLALPGTEDLSAALDEAMKAIVAHNPDLVGTLPQGYGTLPDAVLRELMRLLAPLQVEGDACPRAVWSKKVEDVWQFVLSRYGHGNRATA